MASVPTPAHGGRPGLGDSRHISRGACTTGDRNRPIGRHTTQRPCCVTSSEIPHALSTGSWLTRILARHHVWRHTFLRPDQPSPTTILGAQDSRALSMLRSAHNDSRPERSLFGSEPSRTWKFKNVPSRQPSPNFLIVGYCHGRGVISSLSPGSPLR